MRRIKACLLAASLPFATAMSGDCSNINFPPGGRVCTMIAVASVILNIRDTQGAVVPSAIVSYRVNNGAIQQGGCTGGCGAMVLTYEVVGKFDINVQALGFAPQTLSVNVPIDDAGCHPVTQNVQVVMQSDTTAAALAGVWRVTSSFFGDTILRFGNSGEIIGAILVDRTIAGDGNFYISYNGRPIRGVPGQQIHQQSVTEPTRIGNQFNWETTTLGIPVGFTNATMSNDFQNLNGTLQATPVSYRRLALNETPTAILDP